MTVNWQENGSDNQGNSGITTEEADHITSNHFFKHQIKKAPAETVLNAMTPNVNLEMLFQSSLDFVLGFRG